MGLKSHKNQKNYYKPPSHPIERCEGGYHFIGIPPESEVTYQTFCEGS